MMFDANTPIYLQIMEEIKRKIASGSYAPSQKVAPVRELALAYGVNPNTMQRALMELEREHLVYSERTSGRYICNDIHRIQELKATLLQQEIDGFLHRMRLIGYDEASVLQHMKERLQNGTPDKDTALE